MHFGDQKRRAEIIKKRKRDNSTADRSFASFLSEQSDTWIQYLIGINKTKQEAEVKKGWHVLSVTNTKPNK